MPRLSIALFGAPRVELDGVPLDITTRKAIALLAYLAVTQTPHTRDELATLLWPEADQQHARGALRYTLVQLKSALGEGWLQTSREQISLIMTSSLVVDVTRYDAFFAQIATHGHNTRQVCQNCLPLLEAAVALQRGSLLAGFTLPDSPAFDDWLFFESERLQRQQIEALTALVDAHRNTGAISVAIEYAQRWLALDPLEESVNQLLIQLYIDNNQLAAARRHYVMFAKRLDDELHAEPDEATTALIEQLDHAEAQVAPPRPAAVSAPKAAAPAPNRTVPTLPMPTTPLLGRAHELDAINALLDDSTCRILTLLGPGGSGKTRMSLAVAHARQSRTSGTVVFVPLASLRGPEAFAITIAEAIGFSSQVSGDLQQHLLEFFREKQYLLVLDNLEQLLQSDDQEPDPVRTLLDVIVKNAPGIQLLVTSRIRLQLYEEQVYQLQGLAYPDWDSDENAEAYGAVQLFVQRARRVQSTFELSDTTRPQVVRIVRLLSGQPLAIELAAAWVTTLSLDTIVTELSKGIDLLASEARNIPARHRSMRATYTISWEQLQPRERVVQQALSVFRGGFSYEAAARIAGATPHLLQALIDQSLLERSQKLNDTIRYDMHELLRQFAAEKLVSDPQLETQIRDRHAAYYLELGELVAPALQERPDDEQWARVRQEYDNQLAALQWVLEQQKSEEGLRLCLALSHLWDQRGQLSEARHWIKIALALPGEQLSVTRADALDLSGRLAVEQGDWPQAMGLLAQSLAISRSLGDTRRIARQLRAQGWLALMHGEYADSRELLEESVAIYRALADQYGIARALGLLGQVAYEQGAFTQAVPLLNESLAISRTLDDSIDMAWTVNKLGLIALYQGKFREADQLLHESLAMFQALDYAPGMAWIVGSLGWIQLDEGHDERAAELFTESLLRYSEFGNKRNIAFCLERLACLAAVRGQISRATRLFGAAQSLREEEVIPLPPVDREHYAQYMALIHSQLDTAQMTSIWNEGGNLPIEQAISYALQPDDRHDLDSQPLKSRAYH